MSEWQNNLYTYNKLLKQRKPEMTDHQIYFEQLLCLKTIKNLAIFFAVLTVINIISIIALVINIL